MRTKSIRLAVLVMISLIVICVNKDISIVQADMPLPVSSQSSFEAWLLKIGKPVFSKYNSHRANYEIFKKYKLLTYGRPQDVPGIRYDSGSKQYSAHGFSYDEFTVTNTYFPDDSIYTTDPRKWKNLYLGKDSEISWQRLSEREKQHIKSAQIFYMGQPYGNMTFSSLSLTENKCVVIAVPSWYMGFALYTSHYNSRGELRYGTLHGNGAGSAVLACSFGASAQSSGNVFHIPYNANYVDVSLKAQGSVASLSGLAVRGDIVRGGVGFCGKNQEASGGGPWTLTSAVRYYCSSTIRTSSKVRNISEKATVWIESSMGDMVYKEVMYSFTIIEDPIPAPTVTPTPAPQPTHYADGVFTVRGDIEFFNGRTSYIGLDLLVNPKRFMCLERLTLRVDFVNGIMPERVVFHPVGAVSAEVPVMITGPHSGFAELKYYIGVIPSTVNWKNQRLSEPLSCRARVYYSGTYKDLYIYGIDITGSIYDIIYIQGKPAC